MSQTSEANNLRQQFLLTFFPDSNIPYERKKINGFILEKHIVNGDPKHLQVAIYTQTSWKKYQHYLRSLRGIKPKVAD